MSLPELPLIVEFSTALMKLTLSTPAPEITLDLSKSWNEAVSLPLPKFNELLSVSPEKVRLSLPSLTSTVSVSREAAAVTVSLPARPSIKSLLSVRANVSASSEPNRVVRSVLSAPGWVVIATRI